MVRSGGADGQQSLGDLVALAARDMSQLLRYEISLAKSELRMDARRIGMASALAVIGLFGMCLVFVLLSFAMAFGLNAAGIWLWASFLIVAGTCVVLIGLAVLVAVRKIQKVSGMKLTRQTVLDDIDMLRRAEPSANGSGHAVVNPGGPTSEIPARK